MHYHKCAHKMENYDRTGSRCGQTVAVCASDTCEQDHEHFCSIHHPDPAHHVDPTPPLKKTPDTGIVSGTNSPFVDK